ncbi:hypothetical protein [Vibrio hangzhouensis]|uniref:hypothetical protein n=1 Tax=Vibrio hangzhouensis TaxID=462991 RepID=UPI000CDE6107|nr:hypothetical protein [Vibrio hangzhouensis]
MLVDTKNVSRCQKSSGNTRSDHREANMSVKFSIVQTDFPLGVEKPLNLSELGIHDEGNGE